jgi:lysozyme
MKINDAGLEIIKRFEGWSESVYLCPAGRWTIGYGSTWDDRANPITADHADITRDEGDAYVRREVGHVEAAIERIIQSELTENMFSALGSFAYNCGTAALQRSTLRMKINRGEYASAADEFKRWCRGGGRKLRGLVLRRAAERLLFLT